MKKPITILATVLIMLSSVAVSISADLAPFEVEGVLTEFSGVDDMSDYIYQSKWEEEPWYNCDIIDQRILNLLSMRKALFVPNDYGKSSIAKIQVTDTEVIITLADNGIMRYRYRDSHVSEIYYPHEFIFKKSGIERKLGSSEVRNIMTDEVINEFFGGSLLEFNSVDELLDYIENKSWKKDGFYYPLAKDAPYFMFLTEYVENNLYIPIGYNVRDIVKIVFEDANKLFSVHFSDGKTMQHTYINPNDPLSLESTEFLLRPDNKSVKVYNAFAGDESISVSEPKEITDLIIE